MSISSVAHRGGICVERHRHRHRVGKLTEADVVRPSGSHLLGGCFTLGITLPLDNTRNPDEANAWGAFMTTRGEWKRRNRRESID